MLYCGLRSAEVLGLDVSGADIGGRWVQVTGKGNRERRVPLAPDVGAVIQAYLLAEWPETASSRMFIVAKGPKRGKPLSEVGCAASSSITGRSPGPRPGPRTRAVGGRGSRGSAT
jgi:integrase/recombinase XerD